MKLFKKKEEKKNCCTCSEESMPSALQNQGKGPRIKVLGSGCSRCYDLEKSVKDALKELQKQEDIEHITDFSAIASYGVMSTPALVIDGKVVSYGKVLNKEEVIHLFHEVGF